MSTMQNSSREYEDMICQSLTEYGSSDRLRKAMNKAQTDTLKIAFLGGSVTHGYTPNGMIAENYTVLVAKKITDNYCKDGNHIEVNTAASTTGSIVGLALAEGRLRDTEPDIVFVEFAINNAMDKLQIAYFESLIDKILHYDTQPAVILVILCMKDFYTCSSYMELIAKHYELPVANVYMALKMGIEQKVIQWECYSCDSSHPIEEGHKLIADCILQQLEHSLAKEDEVYELPLEPCFSREFSSYELLDHNSLFPQEGSYFTAAVTNEMFPCGWNYSNKNGSEAFRFTLACKSLFVLFELSNSMDYGEIEILEEGRSIARIDGYSIYGWYNTEAKLVIHERETKLHQLEIKIRKGDENKKFCLLGFGVIR